MQNYRSLLGTRVDFRLIASSLHLPVNWPDCRSSISQLHLAIALFIRIGDISIDFLCGIIPSSNRFSADSVLAMANSPDPLLFDILFQYLRLFTKLHIQYLIKIPKRRYSQCQTMPNDTNMPPALSELSYVSWSG
jgi:hypothetical protein